jgi:CheY-like chemotaxis protein
MAVILVVEDEEQVRVLAQSILQDAGHRTLSAATVDQALALVRAEPLIELIFTDINLADDAEAGLVHPGLELAQQARRLRPRLRVLYTTGAVITDGMQALFVEDASFLAKPYDIEQLSTKVAELVTGNKHRARHE